MNQGIQKELQEYLKETGKLNGVSFSKCELTSAAREMGILDQIEINYPSKIQKQIIPVEIPNPRNRDNFKNVKVKHESRVLMTTEEAIEHHNKIHEDAVIERLSKDESLLEAFIERLRKGEGAKSAAKSSRNQLKKAKV